MLHCSGRSFAASKIGSISNARQRVRLIYKADDVAIGQPNRSQLFFDEPAICPAAVFTAGYNRQKKYLI
jgi:hypothetical protein